MESEIKDAFPLNNFEEFDYLRHKSNTNCNLTCCEDDGDVFCFNDKNFSSFNPTEAPPWEIAIRWTFIIPMVILGVGGNLIIIIILLKNRLMLRITINIFILNMSVADLILAIVGPIPFTIKDMNNFWVMGPVWCKLEGYCQSKLYYFYILF